MQRPDSLPVHIDFGRLYGAEDDDGEKGDNSQVEEDGSKKKSAKSAEGVETKKFSQEYVDELRAEAAKHRVKGKDTEAELAEAKAELAEIKKSEMDDLEKAIAVAEEAVTKAAEAEARAVAAEANAKTTAIQSAVALAAVEVGFQDPTDALSMISQDELVDDEGVIQTKVVDKRLADLAEAKPYLIKSDGPGSGDGGPKKPSGAPKTHEERTAAHLKEMTTTGNRVPRP